MTNKIVTYTSIPLFPVNFTGSPTKKRRPPAEKVPFIRISVTLITLEMCCRSSDFSYYINKPLCFEVAFRVQGKIYCHLSEDDMYMNILNMYDAYIIKPQVHLSPKYMSRWWARQDMSIFCSLLWSCSTWKRAHDKSAHK
jgi:hypothetical protein